MENLVFLLSAVTAETERILQICRIVFIVLLCLLSVALVVLILIQPANSSGMGAISGQETETFYTKNKGRSSEGIMKKLTIILSVLILVIAVAFAVTLLISNPVA